MILINSEEKDRSTSDVIKWLLYEGHDFVRMNKEDKVKAIHISMDERTKGYIITNKGQHIALRDITAYWYRRGEINLTDYVLNSDKIDQLDLNSMNRKTIELALKYNLEVPSLFFHHTLESGNFIGRYSQRAVNKLRMLEYAQEECGFSIPDTIVTTEKNELIEFLRKHNNNIICKPTWEISYLYTNSEGLVTFTHSFNKELLDQIGNQFYPTLFQECVPKKYELRIFFFKKNLYPCAIFSQSDTKTMTDFRSRTDFKSRITPYSLSSELKNKILKFIDSTNLNTGSFDFIVRVDGTNCFLEVNPVGQFGFLSYPCNYKIEKHIAMFLSDQEKLNKNE